MPLLFQYFLKLSCSLAVVYLFYRLLLRRLTFYNASRWYLSGYSLLCFFIPLFDVSGLILEHRLGTSKLVRAIPAIENYTYTATPFVRKSLLASITIWNGCLCVFALGLIVLLIRLCVQYYSYRKLLDGAQLLMNDRIKVYQVNKPATPFSFGSAIFINQALHSNEELAEIIRHEFVHVTQRHTIDIIWMEVLCALNWYNPFAWALRHAVRQNLEFIADSQVIYSGVDKKAYQYLLLHVMGAPQFRMATPFNFSSLKKRIVMMNKMKSAKAHLVKFLFILPLLAVLLLAFRNAAQNTSHGDLKKFAKQSTVLNDTTPAPPLPAVTPALPVAATPSAPAVAEAPEVGMAGDTSLLPEDHNDFQNRNPTVRSIEWTEQNIIIQLKSGKKETYRRDDAKSMAAIEKKYGALPVAPPPPPPPPDMATPPSAPEPPDSTIDAEKLSYNQQQLDFLRNKLGQLNDSVRANNTPEHIAALRSYLTERKVAFQREQIVLQSYLRAQKHYLQEKKTATQEYQKALQLRLQERKNAMKQDQKASQEYLQKMQEQLHQKKKESNENFKKAQEEYQGKQKALKDANDSRSSLAPASSRSNEFIIIADSISLNAERKRLTFNGKTILNRNESDIRGVVEMPANEQALVVLDGKEVTHAKSFSTHSGGRYKLVELDKKAAVKKYGAKGAAGVIEIETL